MKHKLDISDSAAFLAAYYHYTELINYFPQLDPKNEEIEKLIIGPYYKCNLVKEWFDIEIHIVNQTWGSTSCGWGGIGGAAMSSKHNFIIKQNYTNLLFVYWDGKLAYIIDSNNVKGYKYMPSRSDAKALYKSKY